MQDIYIYVVKNYHHHGFRTKKSPIKKHFHKNFATQTFCLLPQNFFLQYYVKSEGRSIPSHPDIINASMNLKEKLLSEHRQCSFTSP